MSFKKRAPKGKLRSKTAEELEQESEEEEKSVLDVVKELKLEQAIRRKGAGVVVSTDAVVPAAPQKQDGSTKRIETIMTDQFSGAGGLSVAHSATVGPVGDPGHKKVLEEFINERLGLNHTQSQKPETEEDKLYQIPDHLRVEASDNRDEGAMSWNAGIAEVALPIEYKIRNIEATEAARKRLESEQKQAKESWGSTAPGNLSANFAKHRREWIQDQMHKESPATVPAPHAPSVPTEDKSKRPSHPPDFKRSTDDLAVDRFIKKQRRLR